MPLRRTDLLRPGDGFVVRGLDTGDSNQHHGLYHNRYYWQTMVDFVSSQIKGCNRCQHMESIKTVVPEMTPIVTGVWEILGVDLVGPLTETSSGNSPPASDGVADSTQNLSSQRMEDDGDCVVMDDEDTVPLQEQRSYKGTPAFEETPWYAVST
ncbi:UNVERIFIED_CONTAM: hypothetical protein FKN15_021762 [Acipenser sinensis]